LSFEIWILSKEEVEIRKKLETANKRIGLFGGTFNPIHLGHLRGLEEVREAFRFQETVFIPAAIPPHKVTEGVIEARHRLEMVKLAIMTNPSFSISSVEVDRPGKSYSIDTLQYFRERDENASLFFILGKDAFKEIKTWKENQRLFSLSNFIVMTWPGFGKAPFHSQLPDFLASSFQYDQQVKAWVHSSGHTLHFKEITFLDISSTKVREMIERGESVKYLIPVEVETYIKKHGLYQKNQ
jgi:nicotinate-nucleotide adenylyltransferase